MATDLARAHLAVLLMVPLVSLAGGIAFAQSDTSQPAHPIIVISGTSSADGQTSSHRGVDQEIPTDRLRASLNPTLTLFDVPLNLRLLLSTEQDSRRQRINGFRLGFSLDSRALWRVLRTRVKEWLRRPENDTVMRTVRHLDSLTLRSVDEEMRDALGRMEQIVSSADTTIPVVGQTVTSIRAARRVQASVNAERDSILAAGDTSLRESARLAELAEHDAPDETADVNRATDALAGTGVLSNFEKLFNNFTRFGVGVNYPRYTPLTMDGIPVTGVDFEYSPSSQSLYAALAIGKSQTSIQLTDTALAFHRDVYAARIGYGRKRGSHIHVTGIYAKDDPASLDSAGRGFLTPDENVVLGIDVGIPIVPGVLQIDGELNGSMLTVDQAAPSLNNGDIPRVVTDVVEPRVGSHGDWTASVGAAVTLPGTGLGIRASYKRVGAGYRTLGAPRIRTDFERVEGRVDGRVWKNRIGFGITARTERDNLLAWKRATTRTMSFGFIGTVTTPNYPTFMISVTPVFQTNDATDANLRIDNTIVVMSATSAYSFPMWSAINALTASVTSQSTRTLERDFNLGSNAVTVADAVILPVPLSFASSVTYSWPLNVLSESISRRVGVDLSATYVYDNAWRTTVGTIIANELNRNGKLTLYARTGFPVWKLGDIDLRAEKTIYDDTIDRQYNYDEVVLKAGVAAKW